MRHYGYNKLIVGVTGNALDDDVAQFLDHGADIVFSKPFNTQYLDALVRFIDSNSCLSRHGYKLSINGKNIVSVKQHLSLKSNDIRNTVSSLV